jgi:maltose-binding protein MalE
MKKTLLIATLSVAAAITLSACTTAPTTTLPPGKYERTSKSVNSEGTAVKKTTSTNVYYDENGNKKATVDTSTTRDPKGLFNKSTTQTRETYR